MSVLDEKQTAAVRAQALHVGKLIARKLFAKRGNHVEAHLREHEVAALAAVAYEAGVEAGYESGHMAARRSS